MALGPHVGQDVREAVVREPDADHSDGLSLLAVIDAVGTRLIAEAQTCRSEPASIRALADLANAYGNLVRLDVNIANMATGHSV